MFPLFGCVVIRHVKVSLLCSYFNIADAVLHDMSQHGASTGKILKEPFFFSPFGKKENNKKPTVLFTAMWNENLLCRFCEQTVYFVTVMKWLSIFSFKLKYTHRLANVQILNLFYIQILRWNLELISEVIETIEAGKNMHVFNNAFLCEPWG